MDIADWRKKIDAIDQQLVALLNQRCECALAIGALKRERALPIAEPVREDAVMANLHTANRTQQGPLPDAALDEIFTAIMAQMRHLQSAPD
ncbi:MAG: chorismate mutase [Terriglobales bacterium]